MGAQHRSEGVAQAPRERSVLSLTKYIAYPLVAHAGGQYLLAHDRALSSVAEIEQLAPDIPLNREALPLVDGGPAASLLGGARLNGLALACWRLESVWAGSAIYRPVRRLFSGDRAPWSKLETADAIEFQWSEMIALAPLVRRRSPDIPLIGVAHDVITQRLERQAAGRSSALSRMLLRLAAARSRRREAASFAALDLLIVFSEKDAAIARSLSPSTRVEVVHPGLGPADPLPRAPRADEPIVLFTGAMNRPENWRGVLWFLDEVWPAVLSAVPSARFVIAGAKPPEALTVRVSAAPRAELTGFVDSLEPYYAEASVFVAPLREGAGVKFKTVDALLRGVPVVSTEVGAEGIDAPELFAAVTDGAPGFAEAVVRQLRESDDVLALRAQRWADGVYGTAAFELRLRDLYLGVIDGRAASRAESRAEDRAEG